MGNYTYKHVVIVGLDGMGAFDANTDTPEMDRIFDGYASSHRALSLYPTISAQNWGAMLIGTDPDVHGLTNGIVGRELYTNRELPSIFTTVRKAMPDSVLCSISNWAPINYGIIEHDVGVYMEDTPDGEITTQRVVKCVLEKKPTLLFIQNDDPDHYGHKDGYGTEGHLECIKRVDGMVGRVFKAYEDAGIADDTLFITITDHGGFNHGHGGYSDGEKYIFFGLRGKTVADKKDFFAQTKDINAIVRHAFGIEIPEYNENGYSSQLPEGVFTDASTSYKTVNGERFDMKNAPTPAIDSASGLYSFFPEEDIKLAMFFDNDINDAAGHFKFTEHGNVKYYTNGVRGSTGEFGITGFITSEEVKFGNDSFSVSAWLKVDDAPSCECFYCSNKTMAASGPGFTLGFTVAGSIFGIETDDPSSYVEVVTPYFREISGGWINILFSIDKKNLKVDVFHNFRLKKSVSLPEIFNSSVDALNFTIGEEGSNTENQKAGNLFNMDDLIVFNRAFTEDDAKKLAAYYGL